MQSQFPFMNRKWPRAGPSKASPGCAVRDFLRLPVACDLGNDRLEAVEGLLQNAPRSGKADAQMSGRSGTEPARRAGNQSDAGLLVKLPAEALSVIAEAVHIREDDVGSLRRVHPYARPGGQ